MYMVFHIRPLLYSFWAKIFITSQVSWPGSVPWAFYDTQSQALPAQCSRRLAECVKLKCYSSIASWAALRMFDFGPAGGTLDAAAQTGTGDCKPGKQNKALFSKHTSTTSHSLQLLPAQKRGKVYFAKVHLNPRSLCQLSRSNLYHILTNTDTYVQNNTLYSSRPSFILWSVKRNLVLLLFIVTVTWPSWEERKTQWHCQEIYWVAVIIRDFH